jgi:hypothetical protein
MTNGGDSELGLSESNFYGKYVILTRTLDFKSIFSYNDYETEKYGDLNGDGKVESIRIELIRTDDGCVGFTPMKNCRGIFDGQGFEIQNLYVNCDSFAGLFGTTFDMIIKNLGITGEIISTSSCAGGIAGYDNNGKFINCYNKANIIGSEYTGGIVGTGRFGSIDELYLDNCWNIGKITSKGNAGGIAGVKAGQINNCYNLGEVTSYSGYAGGILGESCGVIIFNCYNTGNVMSGGWQAGGILGYEYTPNSTVENCYNIGDLSVTKSAVSYRCSKGIGGTQTINCYNLGTLTSDYYLYYAIGTGTIENCYYNSSICPNVSETENINDVKDMNITEFVNLLNSYTDDTGVYPENWKKWKVGENGYPIFE